MKALVRFAFCCAIVLLAPVASADPDDDGCQTDPFHGSGPDGTGCDGLVQSNDGGGNIIWRITLPTPVPPATTSERILDIDLISMSANGAVYGGGEVELAHVVFTTSAGATVRAPIRLKRNGTEAAPLNTYAAWTDSLYLRSHTMNEVVSGSQHKLSISVKLICDASTCMVKMLDYAWNPALWSTSWALDKPSGGATAALEFGIKAGYTSNTPVRTRNFKPRF